jgi:hypothetical protein
MADRLFIGGGGSVVVTTDHLLETREVIERCARTTAETAARVRGLGRSGSMTGARDWGLEQAAAAVLSEAHALEALGTALRGVTEGYGWAERRAEAALEQALAPAAALVAYLSGRLGVVLLPSFVVAAATAAASWALLPRAVREQLTRSATESLSRAAHRALSDRRTTSTLRLLMTAADDAVLGALGVPPVIVAGASALGNDSVARTAGAALAIAVIAGDRGLSPVAIARAGRDTAVTAPRGVEARVARIPKPERPVRIERYIASDGTDRFEVYIAGTATSEPDGSSITQGGENPWDMASNLALIAENEASSVQAVRLALADAGVTEHAPVVFTGFSQGAAIAALLAESGDYATAGLVTVGGPTGGIPVTGQYPAIVIAHDDDPITALGGPQQVTNAVVVTASRGPAPWVPGDSIVAGHSFTGYVETAGRVDDARASIVRETIERLPAPETQLGASRSFTAKRLPPG